MPDQPLKLAQRLHTRDRHRTVGHERRNAAESERRSQVFICKNVRFELLGFQRVRQRAAVHAQSRCQSRENVDPTDIFAPFEQSLKKGPVVILEAPLRASPFRCLVCSSRSGLHRRKAHRLSNSLGHRVNGAVPDTLQILTVRRQSRDWLRAELECSPDDINLVVTDCKFSQGRLRQPAERSDVVGENFERNPVHESVITSRKHAPDQGS